MIKNHIGLHVKYPSFLPDFSKYFLENLSGIFNSRQIFQKLFGYKNFMKIRPAGAELYHADRRTDGQTDVTKLIVAFRNFSNEPRSERMSYIKEGTHILVQNKEQSTQNKTKEG